jgi:hypothetical protein
MKLEMHLNPKVRQPFMTPQQYAELGPEKKALVERAKKKISLIFKALNLVYGTHSLEDLFRRIPNFRPATMELVQSALKGIGYHTEAFEDDGVIGEETLATIRFLYEVAEYDSD